MSTLTTIILVAFGMVAGWMIAKSISSIHDWQDGYDQGYKDAMVDKYYDKLEGEKVDG